MSSRQPAQQIDQQQLVHLSRVLTRHHVLRAREWDHRSPLLQGRMRLHELQPGLFLRLADVRFDMQECLAPCQGSFDRLLRQRCARAA